MNSDPHYSAAGQLTENPLHQYTCTVEGNLSTMDAWYDRTFSLDPVAGYHVQTLYFSAYAMAAGNWSADYTDLVIHSANGDVHPVFNGSGSISVQWWGAGMTNQALAVGPTATDTNGTRYYIDDQLGTTALELNATGRPIWKGDYTPFGQDIISDSTTNAFGYHDNGSPTHYKFTGKERDAESGLDYFGARYYASNMGRWMSPDWSDPAQPVPYANLDRPQSLNLYNYVENNPLSQIDDDGHSTVIYDGQAQTITVRANDGTETTFPASNNPQMSLTIGKLVDGNYAFLDTTRPHHHSPEEDSHNGAYGPGGIFRLKPFKGADGKEHDGVGLHAGRADSTDRAGRSGCNYATNGCVRTTEKAIQFIINLAPGDPLTDLQVRNNRKPPKDDHGDHPSPAPKPPKPPRLIPRADGGGGGND